MSPPPARESGQNSSYDHPIIQPNGMSAENKTHVDASSTGIEPFLSGVHIDWVEVPIDERSMYFVQGGLSA